MCAVDALDDVDAVLVLARLDEYDDAVCATSSSRSADTVFVAFVADDDCEPVAAVATVLGACAANHAPRPRKDAALTAPVIRRARRAGCGFFDVLMV